jgi:hypothetical protein
MFCLIFKEKEFKRQAKILATKSVERVMFFYEKQNKVTKSKSNNTKRNITHKKLVKTGKLLSATLL